MSIQRRKIRVSNEYVCLCRLYNLYNFCIILFLLYFCCLPNVYIIYNYFYYCENLVSRTVFQISENRSAKYVYHQFTEYFQDNKKEFIEK